MRLYTAGVKLPKLGTIQDKIIQEYMSKEAEREIKKTQLLTFIAMNTIQASNQQGFSEYESKIKKSWGRYLELELGMDMPEHTEKELKLAEYYSKVVKKLKPRLLRNKRGQLSVEGIDILKK